MSLSTSFKDDVLDTSVNESRKYTMITNSDGTVSFIDVTTYTTQGSTFTMGSINIQNSMINNADADADSLEELMDEYITAITDELTTLGVTTDATTDIDDVVTNISTMASNKYAAGVSAVKVGTAVASNVLSGYTFTNASSVGLTGTMTNYSSSVRTITCSSSSGTVTYDIADGYHTSMIVNQTAPYSGGYSAKYSHATTTSDTYAESTLSLLQSLDDAMETDVDLDDDNPENFHNAVSTLKDYVTAVEDLYQINISI